MPWPSCGLSRSRMRVSHFWQAARPARHDQPHRRAMDVRDRLAVHGDGDQRVLVHRLVDPHAARQRVLGRVAGEVRVGAVMAGEARPSFSAGGRAARRAAARRSIRRSRRRRCPTGCRAPAARRRRGRCRRIPSAAGASPAEAALQLAQRESSGVLTSPSMLIFQAPASAAASGICAVVADEEIRGGVVSSSSRCSGVSATSGRSPSTISRGPCRACEELRARRAAPPAGAMGQGRGQQPGRHGGGEGDGAADRGAHGGQRRPLQKPAAGALRRPKARASARSGSSS